MTLDPVFFRPPRCMAASLVRSREALSCKLLPLRCTCYLGSDTTTSGMTGFSVSLSLSSVWTLPVGTSIF